MNTNIDLAEIAKFDALAQEWWDPKGPMKPLHQLNPYRLDYVKRHATLPGKQVLDIGCGGGILAESLTQEGAITTGIDMSERVITIAKQHAEKNRVAVTYQQIRTEDFAQKNPHCFDVITCMEMLEHVSEPLSIIQAATRLIKSDGVIFFSTINRNVKSFMTAIIGAEYFLRLLPRGTHHYDKFIRPSELTAWCKQAGLTLRHLQGITYNPLVQKFHFTNSVDVNYLAVFTLT